MMFRGTKPVSPRGSERVNVETIGGRSSRYGLPQARLRNQTGNGAPFFLILCTAGDLVAGKGLIFVAQTIVFRRRRQARRPAARGCAASKPHARPRPGVVDLIAPNM